VFLKVCLINLSFTVIWDLHFNIFQIKCNGQPLACRQKQRWLSSHPQGNGRWPLKIEDGSVRWPNTVFTCAFADAIQRAHKDCKKTNMPSIQWSFYLLNTSTICVIFLYNWTQCIDGVSLLLKRYVRKGNDAKNPAILSSFFVTKRTQLNAAHA